MYNTNFIMHGCVEKSQKSHDIVNKKAKKPNQTTNTYYTRIKINNGKFNVDLHLRIIFKRKEQEQDVQRSFSIKCSLDDLMEKFKLHLIEKTLSEKIINLILLNLVFYTYVYDISNIKETKQNSNILTHIHVLTW